MSGIPGRLRRAGLSGSAFPGTPGSPRPLLRPLTPADSLHFTQGSRDPQDKRHGNCRSSSQWPTRGLCPVLPDLAVGQPGVQRERRRLQPPRRSGWGAGGALIGDGSHGQQPSHRAPELRGTQEGGVGSPRPGPVQQYPLRPVALSSSGSPPRHWPDFGHGHPRPAWPPGGAAGPAGPCVQAAASPRVLGSALCRKARCLRSSVYGEQRR